jgi:MraZ protein
MLKSTKERGFAMLGEYKSTLDEKGRLNIPVKLRDELGESFYVAKPLDKSKCVAVYTQESWDDVVKSIRELPRADSYEIKREIFPSAFHVEVKQGRILIPPPLREYAGLDGETVVVGIDDTAEIWNKAVWDSRRK